MRRQVGSSFCNKKWRQITCRVLFKIVGTNQAKHQGRNRRTRKDHPSTTSSSRKNVSISTVSYSMTSYNIHHHIIHHRPHRTNNLSFLKNPAVPASGGDSADLQHKYEELIKYTVQLEKETLGLQSERDMLEVRDFCCFPFLLFLRTCLRLWFHNCTITMFKMNIIKNFFHFLSHRPICLWNLHLPNLPRPRCRPKEAILDSRCGILF